MDIFFTDPNDIPLPPEKMAIRSLTATPHQDGRRVMVEIEITPFLKRPNLEVEVTNQEGLLVSTFSIVEAIEKNMSFVLHLREANPLGSYRLSLELFYADLARLEDESASIKDILIEGKQIVAHAHTEFEINPEK
jgi:hypothetical protein